MTNQTLAKKNTGAAIVLENWVPEQTGVRPRGGAERVASVGSAVVSLFPYEAGTVQRLFASTATELFDVTAPADPDTPDAAVVSIGGYFSTQQITTPGGNYLYAVNGADNPRLFDGTTWSEITNASMPISLTGVTLTDLSQVWLYASRLWFVEQNSLSAWYLAVDSIGGALTEFSLGAVFQEGGTLLFGATWSSSDQGEGMDSRCVFVSTLGEVAIYVGTDPSNAATWRKEGVYKIPQPLGKNAFQRVAGDVLVLTVEGLVSVGQATTVDVASLSLSAVSRPIEPDWRATAIQRQSLPWEMVKWDEGNAGLVTTPTDNPDGSARAQCFWVNLETGGWGKCTGWDARCVAVFNDRAYFGTNGGRILSADRGGSDDGELYTARMMMHPDNLDSPASHKVALMARATFIASSNFEAAISVAENYTYDFSAAPSAAEDSGSSLWDVALWDVALWSGGAATYAQTDWVSLGKDGFTFAPQVQMTFGSSVKPDVEMISLDVLYQLGAPVV